MIKPLFASALSDGVHMHRIAYPAQLIPGSAVLGLGFQNIPGGFTHIVFNSVYTYSAGYQKHMLEQCRAKGLKIVLDIDDYWKLPNPSRPKSKKEQNAYVQDVEFCIKHADIVWCASKQLYSACKTLNNNSHYIPNAAPLAKAQAKGNGKVFGYVATATDHWLDARGLQKSFSKLNNDGNHAIQVGWFGYRAQLEIDQQMRQLFESAGNHTIGHYQKGSAYWWHYKNMDTALAPLAKHVFNQHKSALKGIEAGAMGCAFICSDAPPYEEFEHGTHCLKARSAAEFYDHIQKLHKDADMALDISQNLQDLVMDLFNPQQIAAERIQTLEA